MHLHRHVAYNVHTLYMMYLLVLKECIKTLHYGRHYYISTTEFVCAFLIFAVALNQLTEIIIH